MAKIRIKIKGTNRFAEVDSDSDLEKVREKLNREMSFASSGPKTTKTIESIDDYFNNLKTGKYITDYVDKMASAFDKASKGDTSDLIGLASDFGPGGIAGLIKKVASNANRLIRAREQGYFTDNPLYHGTNKDFTEFKLPNEANNIDSVSRSPVGSLGISLAENPKVANEFADLAGGEGQNVIKAVHRSKNPASIELEGSETNMEIFSTVLDAWDQGFDSIKFLNYTTPKGVKGQNFTLIKDPNQIRSVNAEFNPKKAKSANILSGIGGGAVVGGQILGDDE